MKKRADRSYALRGIDADLWRRVKVKAAYEGRSIRFVLLAFLAAYAEHGYRVIENAGRNAQE